MELISQLKGNLIVSCVAHENEPFYGPKDMALMAQAAKMGGAAAILADGLKNLAEIKLKAGLPIIGMVKRKYADSDVILTPTSKEVYELLDAKVDIIAIDATSRKRPRGEMLPALISMIRNNSQALIMAEVSSFEEGKAAFELGVNLLSYQSHSKQPDPSLIQLLSNINKVPVIAVGNILSPVQAAGLLKAGAHAVVVGSAITGPHKITEGFVKAIWQEFRKN